MQIMLMLLNSNYPCYEVYSTVD